MQPRDEGIRTEDLTRRPEEDEIKLEQEAPDEPIVLEDAGPARDASLPLVAESERNAFLDRWKEIQTRFVDEPRGAVQEADGLVAEVMQHLARTFADARGELEAQWDRQEDVSTEDLRVALQRYRGFFNRLLDA